MALLEYVASVVLISCIYIIFSLGLNLEFGFSGLMNVGHVAFMAIGAYSFIILINSNVPFFAAAPLSIVLAGVSGLILTLPTEKLREDYLAFLTIGFSVLVANFLRNEGWLTGGPSGISLNLDFGSIPLLGSTLNLMVVISVISVIGVYFLLEYIIQSPWGRVLKAIREDEAVAKSVGKNVFSFKVQALVIGSTIAGFAGVLWSLYYTYITPDMFVPMVTFYAWIIVIIGGSGNNLGTIVGGFVFWFLLSGTRFLNEVVPISDERFSAVRMVFVGILLIAILMYRPEGILGKREELVLES